MSRRDASCPAPPARIRSSTLMHTALTSAGKLRLAKSWCGTATPRVPVGRDL